MFNITGECKQISLQENIFIKIKNIRKFDMNCPLEIDLDVKQQKFRYFEIF